MRLERPDLNTCCRRCSTAQCNRRLSHPCSHWRTCGNSRCQYQSTVARALVGGVTRLRAFTVCSVRAAACVRAGCNCFRITVGPPDIRTLCWSFAHERACAVISVRTAGRVYGYAPVSANFLARTRNDRPPPPPASPPPPQSVAMIDRAPNTINANNLNPLTIFCCFLITRLPFSTTLCLHEKSRDRT